MIPLKILDLFRLGLVKVSDICHNYTSPTPVTQLTLAFLTRVGKLENSPSGSLPLSSRNANFISFIYSVQTKQQTSFPSAGKA